MSHFPCIIFFSDFNVHKYFHESLKFKFYIKIYQALNFLLNALTFLSCFISIHLRCNLDLIVNFMFNLSFNTSVNFLLNRILSYHWKGFSAMSEFGTYKLSVFTIGIGTL